MAKSKAAPKAPEAPKKEAKKEVSLKKTKVWNCELYIRGLGRVHEGEECTAEALGKLKNADQYVQ